MEEVTLPTWLAAVIAGIAALSGPVTQIITSHFGRKSREADRVHELDLLREQANQNSEERAVERLRERETERLAKLEAAYMVVLTVDHSRVRKEGVPYIRASGMSEALATIRLHSPNAGKQAIDRFMSTFFASILAAPGSDQKKAADAAYGPALDALIDSARMALQTPPIP